MEGTLACERLPTCIFFNGKMDDMPATAELLKKRYCHGAFEECARFMVAAKRGGASVTQDLYPTSTARAQSILATAPR